MLGNFKRVVRAFLFMRRLKAEACTTRKLEETRMWERWRATPCFGVPSYEEEQARTASEKIAEKRKAKAKTMTMLDKATKVTESTKAETASAKSKKASVLAKAAVLAKASESSDSESESEFDFLPISRCKTRM